MFTVLVQTPSREERVVQCLARQCGIGKGDDNLVQLQGWNIARSHAALHDLDDGVFVEPANGRAQVRLNGRQIDGRSGPLADADVLEIGEYRLRVRSEARGPRPAPTSVEMAPVAAPPSVADAPASDARDLAPAAEQPPEMLECRRRVHAALVKQMDLRRLDVRSLSDEQLRETTRRMIDEILARDFRELPKSINQRVLAKQVLDEAIGLGPLEALIEDPGVSEIMVNAHDAIWIERNGRIEKTGTCFSDDHAVLAAIERIVSPLGRRIDESSPMVDARLKDGSRVNAIIPPIALRGPSLSIRKFSRKKLLGTDLVGFGSLDAAMLEFLETAVRERKNIVVTGGTGSGKTTLLNILSNFIPMHDRVVTIEDAAELKLVQPNLVALEARPPNVEGKGQVTIRDLVKNALRMRPDRIVVGECRGGETLDMLQAMNTGHEGSLTTAHANSPRDAISRIEVMVLMAGMELPMAVVREQIASAVDLIVHQRRYPCGSRKVSHITEVTGIEGGTIQLQEIFQYRVRTFSGADGRVAGEFQATGAIPEFYEELAQRGVAVDLGIFRKPEAWA